MVRNFQDLKAFNECYCKNDLPLHKSVWLFWKFTYVYHMLFFSELHTQTAAGKTICFNKTKCNTEKAWYCADLHGTNCFLIFHFQTLCFGIEVILE